MKRILTCTICPKGCEVEVEFDSKTKEIASITGNACRRGDEYARTECIAPVRTLTSTVRVEGGGLLPVRTSKPIPRSALFDCMKIINSTTARQGMKIGEIVIENIVGTGSDVIASGNGRQ